MKRFIDYVQYRMNENEPAINPQNSNWNDPNNPNAGGITSKISGTKIPGVWILQTKQGFYPVNGRNEPIPLGWDARPNPRNIQWFKTHDDAINAVYAGRNYGVS